MHRCVTSIRRYDDRQASKQCTAARLQSAGREGLFMDVRGLADDLLYPSLQRFGDGISRELAGLHHALDPPLAGGHGRIRCAMDWKFKSSC
jgi:hypothetical protein